MTFGTTEIVAFLAIITVLITAARVAGALFRAWGLPAVIGELVAGIILGPTLFGHLSPDLYQALFKSVPLAKVGFDALLTLASIFLLFVVGLEIKVSDMRAERKSISWMGLLGVTLPYAVGALVGYNLYSLAPENVSRTGFAMLIGAAFAVSALPVIARILLDLELIKTRIGSIIIGSAAVNDIAGWLLFIVALGIAGGSAHETVPVWAAVLGALVLTGLAFTLLPSLLTRLIVYVERVVKSSATAQGVVVVPILFFCAVLTEYLGLHALFGAFILGVALSESEAFTGSLKESIEVITGAFFAPLYFVAVGLKADFLAGFDLGLITLIVVTAFASKFVAARIAGKLTGLTKPESNALGLGLAARGGMGIIVATIAYGAHTIDLRMFEALVVMAVLTSFTAALIPTFLKHSPTRPTDHGS